MKLTQLSFLAVGLISLSALAQDKKPETTAGGAAPIPAALQPAEAKPTTPPDKKQVSAAFGIRFARLTTNGLVGNHVDIKTDLDVDAMVEAFRAVLMGSPSSLTEDQVTNLLNAEMAYQKDRVADEVKKVEASGPENKAKGQKFLEANAKAAGVKVLPDGLQFKVEHDGNGDNATTNDFVQANLRVLTVDGTEVAKVEHQRVAVAAGNLPVGMSEALQMMKAGSKWIVYLPYQLAYNDKSAFGGAMAPPKVGPYSALIFETEVESIQARPPMMGQPGQPVQRPMMPLPANNPPGAQISSGEVVRVPSTDEFKRGSNATVMTPEQVKAEIERQKTNATPK